MKQIAMLFAGGVALAATPALAACPVKAPPGLVSAGRLTIGTMLTNPPQTFVENGQPAGFDIDLSRAIAAEMCLKPRFVNVTFAGLFPGLMSRKFDYLSSGLGITPQRRETFDFVPYFRGGIQFVGRKENRFFFQNEEGLCGLRVATIAGTTQALAIERANQGVCKQKPIDLSYFPSFNDAVIQLTKNSADIAFVDWAFASYISRLMPELAPASPIISGRPEVPRNLMGLAFRKDEGPQEKAVSEAIQALEKDGTYDRLLNKWQLRNGDVRDQSDDKSGSAARVGSFAIVFDRKAFFDTLFSTQFFVPALTTLGITLVAMLIAIILGFGGALAALSPYKALRSLVQIYLGFFRGVPVLVQIVFWYNALPVLTNNAINLPALVAGTIALGLNEGAYMTEIIRAGLISVDPGQREAARALGMTKAKAMRRIVMPQALRVIIPPTGNQFIAMLKTTSLLFAIAVPEIFATGTGIYGRNFKYFEVLAVVSIWYLLLTGFLILIQKSVERRFHVRRRPAGVLAVEHD
ncbi:MAG TPA: ABC transporter substrate-binding protein/permease [Rhizomicrobium sp.]|nr:ABC transporter substrate-binding protein/permease [Rhizomicrobium sp.]